jgi:hypothetical protein
MWKKINLLINGFLIGMLFEYTLRVEVSILPVLIMSVLVVGTLLDIFWLDKLTIKRDKLVKQIIVNTEKISTSIPKGWLVYNAGQAPLHMLWYVHLIHLDDLANNVEEPRQVFVDEYDTYEEALKKAISEINVVNVEKV